MMRLSYFVIALIMFGCSNQDYVPENTTDSEFAANFGDAVNRDFIGQVVDMNNSPVNNAMITIGTSHAQTDENGVFIINGAPIHDKFAYVTASKNGFITGSRSMVPSIEQNRLKIMLIPSTPVVTIASGQTSEIELPTGTKVVFDGNFEDANGQAYNGNVSVTMFHLTPSNVNLASLMPGMLYGKGEDNQEKSLQTFGMLNVELHGSAGQKLQLLSGHTAEIEMVIDASQSGSAPPQIPLWHFDEVNGYWKQQGNATKEGNVYRGQVSHFSWWNCDVFASAINLTINLTNAENLPIISANVVLTTPNGITGAGITNQLGQISGPIPVNQQIIIMIYDICNNLIYSSTVGPFSMDMVISTQIDVPGDTAKNVRGVLTDCNGIHVQNGYAMLKYDDQVLFSTLSDGSFNFSLVVCPEADMFTLTGVNYDNSQYSGNISFSFSPGMVNIGKIPACTTFDEFISFKVNDLPSTILVSNINHLSWYVTNGFEADFVVSCNLPYTDVPAFQMRLIENFSIGLPTNDGEVAAWYFDGTQMNYVGFGLYTPNITINRYDPPGGYVDFTFIGYTGSGTTFTGIGHVLR